MSKSGAPLLVLLSELEIWLKDWEEPWMVIGGVAASLLGRPRLSWDVGALVALSERRWPRFLHSGQGLGFVPRQAEVMDLAHKTGVLLLRHENSGLKVNLVFDALTFEREALSRATWVDPGECTYPSPLLKTLSS